MISVDNINMIIKSVFFSIFSIIIFLKISNCNTINISKKVIIILLNFMSSIIYMLLKNIVDNVMTIFITYIVQVIVLKIILKKRLASILIGVIISISIEYIMFSISTVLEYFLQIILNINEKLLNIIFTLIIESILIKLLLNIKRIKNGLDFMRKDDNIDMIFTVISVFIIVLYALVGTSYNKGIEHIFFYFIILGICMAITVQKAITMYYKQKLTDDTISEYKKEIIQKDNEIEKLKSEAFKISKINHEFYNRQKALELMVTNNMNKFNIEAGADLDILDRISKISSEHEEKMKSIVEVNDIPLTGVNELDDMFKYMQNECFKFGIGFNLQVIGNIYYLINHFIDKNKLETLIGDHIRDAIIAVNSRADNINKEILVILGMHDNFYEFCVYDTGIEFEIDTLLKLGLVPITTHKNDGGTGIGFVTTFETMKNSKASLIIDEKNSVQNTGFTKSVTIKFDGKNEYRIHSYRASDIRKKINDNRIYVSE